MKYGIIGRIRRNLGAVVAMRDITESRIGDEAKERLTRELKILNSELEIRVNERTAEIENQRRTLHDLFMQAPAIVCTLIGPTHVFDLVNPKYQQLFGTRTLKGKPVLDALPELAGQGILEMLESVYQTGNPFIGNEIKMMLSKEEDAPLEEIFFNFIYQAMFDGDNKPYGILVFAYEVTQEVRARHLIQNSVEELKRLNEEFQFVTNFMPQLVWSTRPDGYHEFYNKGWYDYTGLSYEQTKDRGWSLVLHPDDYDRSWHTWNHSLTTGDSYQIEYRFRKFDGSYRWFLGRALPLRDEEGKIIKWFGTCTDINDQKVTTDNLVSTNKTLSEINLELSNKNEELIKINSDLDAFIYTASHDLKAPVSNIEGLVNTLTDILQNNTSLNDEVEPVLQMIEHSIERFSQTIKDLTTISKTQKDLEDEISDINLKELVDDIKNSIRDQIVNADAKIKVDCTACPIISFSLKNLKSILYNLISNAIKYRSPDRDPEVHINTYVQEGYIILTVADNGLGFSAANKSKMFKMFKRFHDHVEGSGVGLYLVKRIMDNAGGKIEVDSVLGSGTTFKMYFKI